MVLQINDNTPVIIGVGQAQHDAPADLSGVISPVEITAEAVKRAIDDAGLSNIKNVDRLTSIRTFADSGPMFPSPFGSSKNMPKAVALKSDLSPKTLIYSAVGGDQPQTQVMETAKALYAGEATIAVICGGEAIANMKAAMRAGVQLDWSDDLDKEGLIDDGPFPEGLILSAEELKHGLMQPLQFYAMAETARRLDLGLSVSDYQKRSGELLTPFSQKASENPFSISSAPLSAEDIATPTDRNKVLAEPYTKAMIAKDGVNQAAAIVMTTLGKAKSLGLDDSQCIFLKGFAKAKEGYVSEREDVSNSTALTLAFEGAMCSAGVETSEIKHADLYSCFPIVVERAKDCLKEAPLKSLTLTGGLPFFGGAGNNYSLHAIAEMVSELRAEKKKNSEECFGLVFANGGFMTKHSVGVYSTHALDYDLRDRLVDFSEEVAQSSNPEIDSHYTGNAKLLSYALSYHNGQSPSAVVLAETSDRKRVLARYSGDIKKLSTLSKGERLDVQITAKGHEARLGV